MQIILPENYLEEVYEEMRAEGALCVADEVQCGFGRHGSHFWAFAEGNVVPDIVTLGKPIGNGFPMGAVVSQYHLVPQGLAPVLQPQRICRALCLSSCIPLLRDGVVPCMSLMAADSAVAFQRPVLPGSQTC